MAHKKAPPDSTLAGLFAEQNGQLNSALTRFT
jgi:hypothetical protein